MAIFSVNVLVSVKFVMRIVVIACTFTRLVEARDSFFMDVNSVYAVLGEPREIELDDCVSMFRTLVKLYIT